MNMPARTFDVIGPTRFLDMLRWDVDRLREVRHTDHPSFEYLALHCALTAWSLCDWVYPFVAQSLEDRCAGVREFRLHMQKESHWLGVCRELADSWKHRTLRAFDPNLETKRIDTTDSLYIWVVTVSDVRAPVDLRSVMEAVLGYWEGFFKFHGLTPESPSERC